MKTATKWIKFSDLHLGDECFIKGTDGKTRRWMKTGNDKVSRHVALKNGGYNIVTWSLCDWNHGVGQVQVDVNF